MNNLKSSIFNINLDVDEQHYIYNTSSNTLIQVDKDLLDFMDNDEIAFLILIAKSKNYHLYIM